MLWKSLRCNHSQQGTKGKNPSKVTAASVKDLPDAGSESCKETLGDDTRGGRPEIPGLERWMQKDQAFKVILFLNEIVLHHFHPPFGLSLSALPRYSF